MWSRSMLALRSQFHLLPDVMSFGAVLSSLEKARQGAVVANMPGAIEICCGQNHRQCCCSKIIGPAEQGVLAVIVLLLVPRPFVLLPSASI